jgi:LemA protein
MKWLVPVGIVLGVLVVGAMIFGGTYNSLVSKAQAVDGQWAQVEAQYQRRLDLIPNLVETTKGFFAQEKAIFDSITSARAAYSGARTTDEKAAAATSLESSLSRLLVIVEQNPQIKSNETVARLMDELAGTENRISVERRRYNELVQSYNTSIKTFPNNLLAGMFGFTERKYFEAAEGAEQAPTVDFNTDK